MLQNSPIVTEQGSSDELPLSSSESFINVTLSAIRVKHWIKNFFIFAPLLFSMRLFETDLLIKNSLAFVSFCFAVSSVYLLNDIFDYKKDKDHPVKRLRPIASGRLKIAHARWMALLFLLLGLAIAAMVNIEFIAVTIAYLALNALYSSYLKKQVILDVLVLSLFYVIRVVAGGFAIGVHISDWLLICTFLLALFLGFGKRRHELVLLKDDAQNHRAILSEYSPYFLDQMIAVVTSSTLVAYSLYTMSQETIDKFQTNKMPLTIPFVLYGIFRYLYLVHQKEEGGSPTQLMLTDKPLILTVLSWAAAVFVIIYLK